MAELFSQALNNERNFGHHPLSRFEVLDAAFCVCSMLCFLSRHFHPLFVQHHHLAQSQVLLWGKRIVQVHGEKHLHFFLVRSLGLNHIFPTAASHFCLLPAHPLFVLHLPLVSRQKKRA